MNSHELRIIQAFAYFCRGDFTKAMQIYDDLLKAANGESRGVLVEALIGKGRILIKKKKYADARALISRLRELTTVTHEVIKGREPKLMGLRMATSSQIRPARVDIYIAEINLAEGRLSAVYSLAYLAFSTIAEISNSKGQDTAAIAIDGIALAVEGLFETNKSNASIRQHLGMEKAQLRKSLRAPYIADPMFDLLKTMWSIRYYQHRIRYEGGVPNYIRLALLMVKKQLFINWILK